MKKITCYVLSALGVLLFTITNSMAASISFVPSSQTIFVAETAIVDILISGLGVGTPPTVGSYNLRVTYDPSIVDADAPVFGTGLGDETLMESLSGHTLSTGEVEFAQVSLLDEATLETLQPDEFLLATLQFTGISPGTTLLMFTQLDVYDNSGELLLDVTGSLGSITVIAPTTIPVPGSAILFGTALLGLMVLRRRPGRCFGLRMAGVALVALGVVPAVRGADIDDVADYAKKCFERAGITDLSKLSKEYVCEAGTQLFTTDAGVKKDKSIKIAPGNLMANPNAAAAPLATCDRPAWLPEKGTNQRCYGNSYVQELPDFKAIDANLQAVLLCRHKLSTAMEDDPKKFRDIAMIVYNKSNGQTCWFQTSDGDTVVRDGTKVPAPHLVADNSFWRKPASAATVDCITCHDNGPWMNSRWMNDKFDHPANTEPVMKDGLGPYKNEGFGFKDWSEAKRVAVKRDGLPDDEGKSCTSCHRMHSEGTGKHGRKFQSYEKWLDYSISEKFPFRSNADPGQKPAIALWMPPKHPFATKAAWDALYKNHILKLKACMAAAGTAGGSCKEHVAKLNTAPSPVAGARIEASLDSGATWPHVALLPAPDAEPNDQPPISIAPGASLMLRWHADSTFLYCSIEPTFPGGVTSSTGIGAQSYFGLPDSGYNTPVDFGTITASGRYRIDMYCDPGVAASLNFEISGQPNPYLNIQAIVNGSAGPLASNTPGPTSVTTNARLTDPVYITWTAEQMQPNSCVVSESIPPGTPTGQTWTGDVGFEQIAWGGIANQKYSLSCTGKDSIPYTVSTTVHPIPGTSCDVDGNLKIDRHDINLILLARGQSATSGDLRDVDKDGTITVGDARICALRCTNTQCTP